MAGLVVAASGEVDEVAVEVTEPQPTAHMSSTREAMEQSAMEQSAGRLRVRMMGILFVRLMKAALRITVMP